MHRALFVFTLVLLTSAMPAIGEEKPMPQNLPPESFVDALEGTFGRHDGARRSHAKGICVEGRFVGTAEARTLSSASLFNGESHAVIARFSVGGGNPAASDKGKTVRGLALQVELPNGELFVSTMISAPVFFVGTPENFAPFLESRRPDPATGKPDPGKVKAFNAANPDTYPQIAYLEKAPVPASYGTVNYFGIHAFRATDASGAERFVKWRFRPMAGEQGLTDDQLAALPDDFLFEELRGRANQGPIEFEMILQVGEPGDDTKSPIVEWPAERREAVAGRLTIETVAAGTGGSCQDVVFIPLNLPAGLAPSDDPVLLSRGESYAISGARRMSN